MRVFLCVYCLLLFSCSAPSSQSSEVLQLQFELYKSSVGKSTEQGFITAELWNTLQMARQSANKSEFVNAIAYFPIEMAKTSDFKELVKGTVGCLLVSGTTLKQVPLDYYVSFKISDGNWIINDISVKYFLDGTKRFLNYAECDEDKRMSLWLESIQ